MPIEPPVGQPSQIRSGSQGSNDPVTNRSSDRAQTTEYTQPQTGVRRMLDIAVGDVEAFNRETRNKNSRDNNIKVIRFPKAEDFERIRQLVANRTPVRRGTFLNIIV